MRMIQAVYAFAYLLAATLLLNSGEVLAKQTDSLGASQKTTVLIWGDSLSAAYGIPVNKGWVSLLSDKYQNDIKVINGSISGETTQGGLSRLPEALSLHKPSLLVLELGANDGLRGIKTEVMQQNLQTMIDLAKEAEVQVAVIGIRIPLNYGFVYTQKFEQVFLDLAKHNKLPLLPFLLEGVALDFDLMQSDGLHPTAQAQPKILSHVLTMLAPVIAELLSAKQQASVMPNDLATAQ